MVTAIVVLSLVRVCFNREERIKIQFKRARSLRDENKDSVLESPQS